MLFIALYRLRRDFNLKQMNLVVTRRQSGPAVCDLAVSNGGRHPLTIRGIRLLCPRNAPIAGAAYQNGNPSQRLIPARRTRGWVRTEFEIPASGTRTLRFFVDSDRHPLWVLIRYRDRFNLFPHLRVVRERFGG